MTKNEARKKTRELIRHSAARMRENIEKALLSGAINLSSYENDYVLPNTIMLALLREEIRVFKPSDTSRYKRQVERDAEIIYARI